MRLRIQNSMVICRWRKKNALYCMFSAHYTVYSVQYGKFKFPRGFSMLPMFEMFKFCKVQQANAVNWLRNLKCSISNDRCECSSIHHAIVFYLFFILEFGKRIMPPVFLVGPTVISHSNSIAFHTRFM